MSIPLIIDNTVMEQIRDLREFAKMQPVDMTKLMARIETKDGSIAHMAQMTRQTIRIPMGFLATFSIEQGHPCGECRHLSVSVDRDGRLPSPEAVWLLAQEFGFKGGFEKCRVWMEKLRGHGQAVNVVQPMDFTP